MSVGDLAASLKTVACDAIDAAAADLKTISDELWKHPELGFEEKHAHQVLANMVEKYGFQTERSFKLDTAFRATYGSRSHGPNITFISEYDALPEIGHACGHNIIAEVGVGAGIGLMAALKAAGKPLGQITVMGTPAEESSGGKINMIEAGAFSDVDVAMMTHPFPENDTRPIILALKEFEVTYRGKASHAAGYPWNGVNALDAAVMCYNGLSCYRQQMKPTWRLHCIIVDGGAKVNIIPERSVIHIAVRAPTDAELRQLESRVKHIFESAAVATGCLVEHHVMTDFSSMLINTPLALTYEANITRVYPDRIPAESDNISGSTDMGNVSHVVPSIHPMFYIGGKGVNHTREFTDDSGSSKAQPYAIYEAKAMAMTGVDLLLDKQLMEKVKEDFKQGMKRENISEIV